VKAGAPPSATRRAAGGRGPNGTPGYQGRARGHRAPPRPPTPPPPQGPHPAEGRRRSLRRPGAPRCARHRVRRPSVAGGLPAGHRPMGQRGEPCATRALCRPGAGLIRDAPGGFIFPDRSTDRPELGAPGCASRRRTARGCGRGWTSTTRPTRSPSAAAGGRVLAEAPANRQAARSPTRATPDQAPVRARRKWPSRSAARAGAGDDPEVMLLCPAARIAYCHTPPMH
jgi:hypothetical protein